mgnify:CR=1 FL=1
MRCIHHGGRSPPLPQGMISVLIVVVVWIDPVKTPRALYEGMLETFFGQHGGNKSLPGFVGYPDAG